MLRRRLGQQAEAFEIWSAGTAASEGAPMHPLTADVLTSHGAGVRRHRARKLVLADLLGADLVLAAERWHRLQVARLHGEAASKTFTLTEFARISPYLQTAHLTEMIAEAAVLRADHPAAQPADDDVPDPGRGDRFDHERTVMQLAEIITPIAAALSQAAWQAPLRGERARRREPDVAVVLPPVPVAPLGSGTTG